MIEFKKKCRLAPLFPFFSGILLAAFCFGFTYPALAETLRDDEEPRMRWIYGLSLGGYFAHNATAAYYDGSDEEHNLETALNRYYNYDRIRNHSPDIIENFEIYQLPTEMYYLPAAQVGFFGGLETKSGLALMGEFNYTKLKAQGNFTIRTDKETHTSEPFLLLSGIQAEEERIDVRLGLLYTLQTSSYIHPYVESGVSIIDTKIEYNRANIEGLTISIRQPRSDLYNIRDYGIGFGMYLGLGLKMDVSDSFALRIGGSVNYNRLNLGDNAMIYPQFTGFVRLMLNDLF